MKWLGLLGAAAAALSLLLGLVERPGSRGTPGDAPGLEIGEITLGPLVVRTVHQGSLESRHGVTVSSRYQGAATLVELAEEGSRVRAGEVVARFDTSREERELLQHRTEVTLRTAELERLLQAQHPVEILRLEREISELSRTLAAERQYLVDSLELAADNLVSAAEVAQQEGKVEGLVERLAALEAQLALTRGHSHPLERRRAEAMVSAAAEALARAERQIEHGTVRAAAPGVVVYQPLHVGGEYRAARVGDSVHANQPFMMILDFADLVVRLALPEGELAAVRPGRPVVVQPVAFPQVQLAGVVEEVGRVAQTLPDQPAWQRFFRATVGLEEGHPQLRPGMSVIAHVVAYQAEEALQIPRRAVRFEGGAATARVVGRGGRGELRALTLGQAGELTFEVLSGVEAGERVALW